jgi:radical SAM protein with 4Fe4S-binding SPASM domain
MSNNLDFESQPFAATWEMNARIGAQAGDLSTSTDTDDLELSDKEAEQLIRDIAEAHPRVFVITGADPLQRSSIYSLVQYAASCGLHPRLALSPESNVSRATIAELKQCSLSRLELSMEGGNHETHDRNCGLVGSFVRTIKAIQWANESRLPVQIHTHLSRRNLGEIEDIALVIQRFRILCWSISFPVPQQGESVDELPSAREFEEAFARIYKVAQSVAFKVKTVDAPHYSRFVTQQRARWTRTDGSVILPSCEEGIPGVLPIDEAGASVFISSSGEMFPGRWLRLSAGNVRCHRLADVYRNSGVFTVLRDTTYLKGKCAHCDFGPVCRGSRGRAWALSGDLFNEDPSCSYQPLGNVKTRLVSSA